MKTINKRIIFYSVFALIASSLVHYYKYGWHVPSIIVMAVFVAMASAIIDFFVSELKSKSET